MITWEDFEKIEMRVGTVLEVKNFPEARKPAYQMTIDFGEAGIRKSSAQVTDLYQKEDLLNRQVVAVLNFPAKKIAGFSSECLVLGIYNENNEVVLLQPSQVVKNGCRIG